MKTRFFIVVIALLAVGTCASAQGEPNVMNSISSDSTTIPSLAQLRSQVLQPEVKSSESSFMVPGQHRAFFCRFDDKLDEKRIPLRMRLGSVDEVNRMESKPGYRLGGQLPE